jgi:hypothetical protein
MSGKARLCLGLVHTALSVVAKAFSRFAGRSVRLSVQSVQHAYKAHQERAQMRLAPTEPRPWQDVRRVRAGSY